MSEFNEQEKPATHDSLRSLLFNEERDFLIRNDGQRVKVEELEGKHVALYFADRFHASRDFTPVLSKIYEQLLEKGDFEIVFVSTDFIKWEGQSESDSDSDSHSDSDNDSDYDDNDFDEDRWEPFHRWGWELWGKNTKGKLYQAFEESHRTMPWLALPFSDEDTRKKLKQAFQVKHIPSLVVLDKDGKIITPYGLEVFEEFGVEGYPFTAERIDEARAKVKAFRDAQTLESLLVSDERDFVIGHGETKLPVAELLGKTVVLYFAVNGPVDCCHSTSHLKEFYNELRERGEAIEIVFLSDDREERDFQKHYERMPMPWLALPFGDKTIKKLFRYFRLPFTPFIPSVVIVHPDGKLAPEGASFYIGHGTKYYPFTKERLDEIEAAEAKEKARRESQTLESLLVTDERDFVIKRGGAQVPVAELVGKTVGLYFGTLSGSCPGFLTAEIVKEYKEIKKRGEDFEIVFISGDKDQETFEDHYERMPWLALPFGDKTNGHLEKIFGHRYNSLILIGPDGKTVIDEALDHLFTYGAVAFPFSDTHIERAVEELAHTSPKEIYSRVSYGEGPLVLTRIRKFSCEYCYHDGFAWCYKLPCGQDFNYKFHLTCALKYQTDSEEDTSGGSETETETETESEEGVVVEEEKGQKTDGEIDAA